MGNVGWNFYRSRRRINLTKLVDTGKVSDYPSFVSYCENAGVVPSTQQEFDIEFGPLFKKAVVSTTQPVPEAGLEATVWLAGVEDETPRSPSAPAKKKKKESSFESKE